MTYNEFKSLIQRRNKYQKLADTFLVYVALAFGLFFFYHIFELQFIDLKDSIVPPPTKLFLFAGIFCVSLWLYGLLVFLPKSYSIYKIDLRTDGLAIEERVSIETPKR